MKPNTHVLKTESNSSINKKTKVITSEGTFVRDNSAIEAQKNIEITENGLMTITPSSGFDGLAQAVVTVNVPERVITPTLETKDVTFTENSFTELTPTTLGIDGFDKVNVRVAIPTESKEVTINSNGLTVITPETGTLSSVRVTTDVQPNLQKKRFYAATNGTKFVYPDEGYDGLSEAEVVVNVLPTHQTKNVEITANGNYRINPDEGIDCMDRVIVDVAIPLEENKEITLASSGAYEILPTNGNTAMKKVTVTPLTQTKTLNVEHEGTYTVEKDHDKAGMTEVEVNVDIPTQSKNISMTTNDSVTVTPDSGFDFLDKVTFDLNVPQNAQSLFAFKNGNDVIYTHSVPASSGNVKIEIPASTGVTNTTGAYSSGNLYAWKNGDNTIYTTTASPGNGNVTCYNETGNSIGNGTKTTTTTTTTTYIVVENNINGNTYYFNPSTAISVTPPSGGTETNVRDVSSGHMSGLKMTSNPTSFVNNKLGIYHVSLGSHSIYNVMVKSFVQGSNGIWSVGIYGYEDDTSVINMSSINTWPKSMDYVVTTGFNGITYNGVQYTRTSSDDTSYSKVTYNSTDYLRNNSSDYTMEM